LFTNPRTASHLLTKLLNLPDQDTVYRHPDDGYIFMRPTLMRLKQGLGGRAVTGWTVHNCKSVQFSFQKSSEDLIKWRAAAEKINRGAFLKFHCADLIEPVSETRQLHGADSAKDLEPWTVKLKKDSKMSGARTPLNETCLPDAVLKTWKPTFLIRHPALVLPSLMRADLDVGHDVLFEHDNKAKAAEYTKAWEDARRWSVSFHWQRQLLEFYLTQLSPSERRTVEPDVTFPVVLDADDIQAPNAPKLMRLYTSAVGLDPAAVKFEWSAAKQEEVEEMNHFEKRLLDTISASTGIVPGKTAQGIVIEDEKAKWREEFGELVGGKLGVWVEDAIEDYEWMRKWRLT
ncbi:hypothetical protein EJ04DRAFT_396098, partial [Polyplosphaeria fusca]